MVRQCAWCLRLIDSAGGRLSPSPLPKLYEASHGICDVCGTQWMEQVLASQEQPMQGSLLISESEGCNEGTHPDIERRETITQFVLQLQHNKLVPSVTQTKRQSKLKMISNI